MKAYVVVRKNTDCPIVRLENGIVSYLGLEDLGPKLTEKEKQWRRLQVGDVIEVSFSNIPMVYFESKGE